MDTPNLGRHIFTTQKKYGVVVFWFLVLGIFNIFSLRDWLNGNICRLYAALAVWSPAFYLLTDRLRARLYVYETGLIYQMLSGCETIRFTPDLQMYIKRIRERTFGMDIASHVKVRLMQDGRQTEIPFLDRDMEKLIGVITDYQRQTVLPAVIRAFGLGKTLDFGAI